MYYPGPFFPINNNHSNWVWICSHVIYNGAHRGGYSIPHINTGNIITFSNIY
jgi:hypothetical protein